MYIVEYLFLFPSVQKYKNLPRNAGVIIENISGCFSVYTSLTIGLSEDQDSHSSSTALFLHPSIHH